MPKDPTKNVDRYKIRGGVINEYEYHENQQELAQNESKGDGKLIPGTPPEEKAEGLRQAAKKSQPQKSTKSTKTKKAATRTKTAGANKVAGGTKKTGTKKAATRTKKGTAKKAASKSVKSALRGASAKKLAARKAAKK